MASKETSKDLLAGLFLLTGICLFFLSVLILGRERNLFGSFVRYSTVYSDVRGLNVGAPVRLGGISVGRIATVALSPDVSDSRVVVTIEVLDEYAARIRADSTATIETQGLLGDKFINISTSGTGAALPPGGMLASHEAADLNNIIRKVEALADTASSGITAVTDISKAIDAKKIAAVVDSLHKVATSLDTNTALSDLSGIVREVKTGSGLLHNLIFPSPEADQLSSSLKAFANAGQHLEKITAALAQGSGTLGALLVDSKVYDNLVEVTDDAKRSFVLRSVVRSALNEKKE